MKKIILLSTAVCAFMMTAKAQDVWDGTSVSTTTLGNASIGVANNTNSRLLVHVTNSLSVGTTPKNGLTVYERGFGAPQIFSVYSHPFAFPDQGAKLLFAVNPVETRISTKVRIGNTAATSPYSNYALSVDGDIVAKKVVVQMTNWADYVFANDYKLKPLEEVEAFIKENKHLPDVPSEATVLKEGADVAEMNRILLQKVEELTLYVLDQNKKIKALEEKISKDK